MQCGSLAPHNKKAIVRSRLAPTLDLQKHKDIEIPNKSGIKTTGRIIKTTYVSIGKKTMIKFL